MYTTPMKKTYENPEYLAQSRKFDQKCACNICVCGKHKCPPKGFPLEGQTTNKQFYKPHTIVPQNHKRPVQAPLNTHYDPQAMRTSYKTHYTPHKIPNERPAKKIVPQAPKQRFQGESQYKTHYSPKKVTERLRTSPSKQYVPNPAKFEDSTTYKHEYSPKKVENPTYARKNNKYQPSKTPFEGQTVYVSDYKPKKVQNRPLTSRQPYIPNQNKFEGQTRYRQFYQPHKIQPRQRCPTEYLPKLPDNCSPGKDHMHFSAQKNIWQ